MKIQHSKIELTLLSNNKGHVEFSVTNAGSIRRIEVAENIELNGKIMIYFGDGHYVPYNNETAKWLGKQSIKENFKNDLINSILKSDVYIGEATNSECFYNLVAKKFCQCNCREPYLKRQGKSLNHKVIALDLEHAKYSRSTSRNIIYIGTCGRCSRALTYGQGIGSFCTVGENTLKQLAEKEVGKPINFEDIITTTSQLI
ncbi:MAG: hypothetical protein ACI92O_000436 [Colwellia sp.]|jgi:hypothetical protein